MKRRKRTNSQVPAKGRLREFADRLWSLAVKHDWAGRCAICGARGDLNSHHLIPRQHYAARYDLRNGICLCRRCHQFCPDRSPHQNAPGFMLWLETRQPRAYRWVREQLENGHAFDGTKSVAYYLEQIQRLRGYVEPWGFDSIVGVRFAARLDENAVDAGD